MTDADVYWAQPQALGSTRVAYLRGYLGATELDRANAFAFAADRDAYITAHGLLRLALADRAGARWTSLSHTRSLVACAVSRGGPVGIDVEPVGAEPPEDELVAASCTPAERAQLARFDGTGRARAFAQLWTLKEAVLKALGVGLTVAPQAVECALDPPRLVRLTEGDRDAGAWALYSLVPAAGHVLALAVAHRGRGDPARTPE